MAVDLHVHSTASDGTLTPEELVAEAVRIGLEAIAVSDHDTVEAVPAAMAAGARAGLEVIPAVELSSDLYGNDLHILGYFVDPTDSALLEKLAEFREDRLERARKIVEALVRAGYTVTMGDVLDFAEGGAVGRSHVARALVGKGQVATMREAFEELIGRGKPYFVAKKAVEPSTAIRLILRAGGVPVLAHPGVSRADRVIPQLIEAGLMGLEAYHAEHSHEQRRHYAAMASRLGLLVTGGSDYHGPATVGADMGRPAIPYELLDAVKRAACQPSEGC